MNNEKSKRFNVFKLKTLVLIILIPSLSLGQDLKKEKNKKTFFTINNDSTSIKEYSSEEIRRQLDEKEGLLGINTKAPVWEFTLNNQSIYSSEKLAGKIYVLDFWGSWCPPCKKAMPTMEKLHQVYKNRKDVIIIGVSAKEKNFNSAENYFNKMDYGYIHLPNGDKVADVFKVYNFPTVFIINQKGLIIDAFTGFDEDDFMRMKNVIDKSSEEN